MLIGAIGGARNRNPTAGRRGRKRYAERFSACGPGVREETYWGKKVNGGAR